MFLYFRESLLRFVEKSLTGVKGVVVDLEGNPVAGVTVSFFKVTVRTNKDYNYIKIILLNCFIRIIKVLVKMLRQHCEASFGKF